MKSLRYFFPLLLVLAGCRDDSSAAFLAPKFAAIAKSTKDFSYFWKGLILLEEGDGMPALKNKVCRFLQENAQDVNAYYCHEHSFRQDFNQLRDWIQDVSIRQNKVTQKDFDVVSAKQLALASLPGFPREMIPLLRFDPFGSTQEFLTLKNKAVSLGSNAIALSFTFSPDDVARTEAFVQKLESEVACSEESNCLHARLSGPHASVRSNKNQVISDLTLVSRLGLLFLFIHCLVLGYRRGLSLLGLSLFLVPSIACAAFVTYLTFGSIFGLTLAFGPGLIGLALDYGMHAKIHENLDPSRLQKVWRSNFFGLLTTLAGFVCLLFSQIPLLKQLSVFTLSGLSFAFLTYAFLSGCFSKKAFRLWSILKFPTFKDRSYKAPSSVLGLSILFLALASLSLWTKLPLNLSLKSFEYREKLQQSLETAYYSKQKIPEILFSIDKTQDLARSYDYKIWADKQKLSLDTWASYIPTEKNQLENLASWTASTQEYVFKPTSSSFYMPYLQGSCCRAGTQFEVRNLQNPPSYVEEFLSKKNPSTFLSVWYPSDTKTRDTLLATFPELTSLRLTFEKFPELLMHEMSLMFPLGILLCLFLIYFHMRHLRYSLMALFPLLTAAGIVLLSFVFMGRSLSFVSCIAVLMIFGTSVDYGIFQVDAYRAMKGETKPETFSSLFMSASTTLLGYLPLAFAKHPVLSDLGVVLSLGTLGAFLGGIWGIPYLIEKLDL